MEKNSFDPGNTKTARGQTKGAPFTSYAFSTCLAPTYPPKCGRDGPRFLGKESPEGQTRGEKETQ